MIKVRDVLLDNMLSISNCTYDSLREFIYGREYYKDEGEAREHLSGLNGFEYFGRVRLFEKVFHGEATVKFDENCKIANTIIKMIGYKLFDYIFEDTEWGPKNRSDRFTKQDVVKMYVHADNWFSGRIHEIENIWNRYAVFESSIL